MTSLHVKTYPFQSREKKNISTSSIETNLFYVINKEIYNYYGHVISDNVKFLVQIQPFVQIYPYMALIPCFCNLTLIYCRYLQIHSCQR